jgi:hypothetical protein
MGLIVMVGAGVFGLIYWLSGSGAATAPAPTPPVILATSVPTALVTVPTTPPDVAVGGGEEQPPACNYPPDPASGFGYGIQSHVFVGDNAYWITLVRDKLHFQWVKMQVRWDDLEKGPGQFFWDVLDSAMKEACSNGLHVMLSVVAAPAWTLANPLPAPEGQAAPPDNYQGYADFLAKLLDRYPGQIGAIEVWNEMNLEREWNTASGINPTEYVKMLATAHAAIKAKDSNVVVISGAPSPTGINCAGTFPECAGGRPIIVDDATYLRQFVEAGGLQFADCIGTHSNGTNLPPTADGTHPPGDANAYTFKGPWNNPHYSWSLKSQVETYAQILNGQKPQCVTEFGYASAVDGKFPANYEFAADVSEQQQAQYLLEAFNWMRDSRLVKMAFLFNLDYGPKGNDPASDDNVIFSILKQDGSPRPAFDALSLMDKP